MSISVQSVLLKDGDYHLRSPVHVPGKEIRPEAHIRFKHVLNPQQTQMHIRQPGFEVHSHSVHQCRIPGGYTEGRRESDLQTTGALGRVRVGMLLKVCTGPAGQCQTWCS